jgi:general L-amino acid transport system permease protein
MSGIATDPRFAGGGPPAKKLRLSWSDPRLRAIVWQVVIIGIVVAILWYLIGNTNRNLAARHIVTGFAFLWRTAGFPIGESPVAYNPAVNTYGYALMVGVLNTLRIAVVGVVLATILGTIIGILRLSPNWLLSRLAALYVELLRDIPVLLQLFFWYELLGHLPGPKQAFHPLGGVYLSNRGIKLPFIAWHPGDWWVVFAFVVGIAASAAFAQAMRRRQEATGLRTPTWPVALLLIIGLPVVTWAALRLPLEFDIPVLRGFNFQGGVTVSPEYGALLIGLVVYTAAYIAEIVRAGLLAVPHGQWEAAAALGLHRTRILRLIVLPQSLRVIIPPMTSQYLNLTKNSSLAVAIGYPEIVSVADTTLNQTGQSIEGIAIVMAVYLTISLSISLFMNWYNAHVALIER